MAVELGGGVRYTIEVDNTQATAAAADTERAIEKTTASAKELADRFDDAKKRLSTGFKDLEKDVANFEKAQTQAAKKAADEAEKAADRSGKAWKTGMALAGGAFLLAIKSAADYADRLAELNQQSGLSVVALQKMDAAARLNGSSLEKLVSSFGTFQDRLVGGDKSVIQAVRTLGINLDALKQQSPDEQMRALAEAVTGVSDPTLRANIATDLFGKSGRALIPTLAEIAQHYQDLPAQSEAAIAATGSMADRLESVKRAGLDAMVQMFMPLGALLTDSSGKAYNFAGAVQWLQAKFVELVYGGILQANKAIIDNSITWSEFLAKFPGASAIFGVTADRLQGLRDRSKELDTEMLALKLTVSEMSGAQQKASDTAGKHGLALVAGATATKTLTQTLQDARDQIARLTVDQKAQIEAGLRMHDSVKNITAALNAQYPALHLTEQAVQEYVSRTKDTVKAHKDQDAQMRLLEQAWRDQRKEIEETEKFQHRYDMALKDSVDQMHKFNQELLDEATKGAGRFDDLIKKEFDQIVDSNKAADDNIRQMTTNSLTYQIDSIRRSAVEKRQMYADDSVLAQQAREAIDREAATAIEQLKRQHDPLRNLFLDIRDQVVNLGQTVNQNFASMLLGAQSFGDGFKNIWNGLKQTAINILTDILEYYEQVFIARFILGMSTGGASWSQALAGAFTGGTGGTGSVISGIAGMGGGAGAGVGIGTAIPSADAAFAGSGAAGAGGGAGIGTAALGAGLAGGAGLGLGLLGTKIFGGSGWKASGFGAATGAATGALIGSVVPGIGTGVGAAVGAIAGAIGGWIGKSVGEKINDARDEFMKQFGETGTGPASAWANLNAELERMKTLGIDSAKIFKEIFQPKGWDDFNQGLKDLDAAFQSLVYVQDRVNTAFTTLQDQQAQAIAQGMDQGDVLKQQAADYSLLYQAIVRTGAQAPDGLMPILDTLVQMGALVDQNGVKVDDLSGLLRIAGQDGTSHLDGLTFSLRDVLGGLDATTKAALLNTDAWKAVLTAGGLIGPEIRDSLVLAAQAANLTTDQINALAGALGVGVTNAARDAADAINNIPDTVTVRTVFEGSPDYGYFPGGGDISAAARGGLVTDSGVQYLATGGTARILGFTPRGTDTVPAMLTPGEGVINRRGMAALSQINGGSVGGDTIFEKGAIVIHGATDPDAVADKVMRKILARKKFGRRAS